MIKVKIIRLVLTGYYSEYRWKWTTLRTSIQYLEKDAHFVAQDWPVTMMCPVEAIQFLQSQWPTIMMIAPLQSCQGSLISLILQVYPTSIWSVYASTVIIEYLKEKLSSNTGVILQGPPFEFRSSGFLYFQIPVIFHSLEWHCRKREQPQNRKWWFAFAWEHCNQSIAFCLVEGYQCS